MKNIYLLVIFALVGLSSPVIAKGWPEVPLPKEAKLIVIADNMIMNGVEMKMWKIESFHRKERTMEFYKKKWHQPQADGVPGFIEYPLEQWDVISRIDGDYQITIQLDREKPKSTDGLVGISKLPALEEAPVLGRGFPSVGNIEIINDITSVDQNKESRTIVAKTDASFKNSVDFYRRVYRRKGWEEQTSGLSDEGSKKIGLMFNRRGKELNLTIVRDGNSTNIVAVLVDY